MIFKLLRSLRSSLTSSNRTGYNGSISIFQEHVGVIAATIVGSSLSSLVLPFGDQRQYEPYQKLGDIMILDQALYRYLHVGAPIDLIHNTTDTLICDRGTTRESANRAMWYLQ